MVSPSDADSTTVADEETAGDPLDLLAVHQQERAPPAVKLEEARRFGVDVRKELVILVPVIAGGIQVLEVLHQVGAIEDAVAQVRGQRRKPRAAEIAPRVTHRVVALAFAPRPAPVGHRRADDHQRPGVDRVGGGQHHCRPARLAIADDGGLGAVGMQLAHLAHELLLGLADIEERLAGFRVAKEHDEVHRMAAAKRHTDLGVGLEPADAGPVSCARVDDHIRTASRVDVHAFGRQDAQQRVVHRPLELAGVEHGFGREMQQRRLAGRDVGEVVVAALAYGVGEQHRALHGVDRVVHRAGGRILCRARVRNVVEEGVFFP
jgi:hypothetical protein